MRGADELTRLRAENEALRSELADTNRGVIALHAELEAHARRLAEADARKDEFLALLAHELRNPLAVILLALDDLEGSPTVDRLRRQAAHMGRLVDDLLDVSRVVRRKIALDRGPLELGALVRQTVADREALLTAGGHRLELALPAEEVWVDADAERLGQVIGNLLDNAVKYSPGGSAVEVRLAPGHERVTLDVRDEGRGLSADEASRVFELFVQTGASLDREGEGLGIGLTLVEQLVRLHGGDVRVRSDGPGRGSTFTVELPRVAPPAAPDVRACEESGEGATAALRVLLVEDGDDLRALLAARMRRRGLSVDAVSTGVEALERYDAEGPYDAVVTDIGLPGLSGHELAEQLRRRSPAPHLVALTGYGDPENRARAREAGFAHHFVKPVKLDALLRALRAGVGEADER